MQTITDELAAALQTLTDEIAGLLRGLIARTTSYSTSDEPIVQEYTKLIYDRVVKLEQLKNKNLLDNE